MDRRSLLAGGAALSAGVLIAPRATRAQPSERVHRIGWLSGAFGLRSTLYEGLRELGWIEGRNIAFGGLMAHGVDSVEIWHRAAKSSIGAGLQAIQPKVTFRDLSTSIDSHDDCQRHRRAPVSVVEAPKKGRHRTP